MTYKVATVADLPEGWNDSHYKQLFGAGVPWTAIPTHMRKAVFHWIEFGEPVGHFMLAFLRNDLKEAVLRADDDNLEHLVAYVKFFYNYAPSECWGSDEQIKEWAQRGGLKGISEKLKSKKVMQ